MYILVKDLPKSLQVFLRGHLDYHRADIQVCPVESVSPQECGQAGNRGYFMVLGMEGWQVLKNEWGSWGGANMFNPTNRVDLDSQVYTIPPNILVVKGAVGYRPHSTIYVRPEAITKFLPVQQEISDREKRILVTFRSCTSRYRKEVLSEMRVTDSELESLGGRGFLKIAKNGATSITTAGKNAVLNER